MFDKLETQISDEVVKYILKSGQEQLLIRIQNEKSERREERKKLETLRSKLISNHNVKKGSTKDMKQEFRPASIQKRKVGNNLTNEFITFESFERSLRFLFLESNDEITIDDRDLMDDLKHSIIVFAMKDMFGETNNIFLENTKRDFYNSIECLRHNHPNINWQLRLITQFMEKNYFNT